MHAWVTDKKIDNKCFLNVSGLMTHLHGNIFVFKHNFILFHLTTILWLISFVRELRYKSHAYFLKSNGYLIIEVRMKAFPPEKCQFQNGIPELSCYVQENILEEFEKGTNNEMKNHYSFVKFDECSDILKEEKDDYIETISQGIFRLGLDFFLFSILMSFTIVIILFMNPFLQEDELFLGMSLSTGKNLSFGSFVISVILFSCTKSEIQLDCFNHFSIIFLIIISIILFFSLCNWIKNKILFIWIKFFIDIDRYHKESYVY